jgi:hypothetical protein
MCTFTKLHKEIKKNLKSSVVFKIKFLAARNTDSVLFSFIKFRLSGGLEVACWPLVPEFAGSNPAEAVGFWAKKSTARLPSEGK